MYQNDIRFVIRVKFGKTQHYSIIEVHETISRNLSGLVSSTEPFVSDFLATATFFSFDSVYYSRRYLLTNSTFLEDI